MKCSIEFDPSEDTPYDVALAVAYAFGFDSVEELVEVEVDESAPEEEGPAPTSYLGGWTKSKMRRYVVALKPNARKVLRVIAENAPEVDVETVQEGSGLDGYIYAGSMSSFGFAARNTHGVKDKPFVKVGKSYQMDVHIAHLVISVLDDM
jgi:hypothetical protein